MRQVGNLAESEGQATRTPCSVLQAIHDMTLDSGRKPWHSSEQRSSLEPMNFGLNEFTHMMWKKKVF